MNPTTERLSGPSTELMEVMPEPSCRTLSTAVDPSPKILPEIPLPNKHSDAAVNKRIKHLFKQIKKKLVDKPKLLEELSSLKNTQSGAPLLDNLKIFKSIHFTNVVNNTNILNANFVENTVINNVRNITNLKPNPCNWSNSRLSKFYAHLEDPNVTAGLEKFLQQPAWLTQFSSVGRGLIKKEKSFQTETVIE